MTWKEQLGKRSVPDLKKIAGKLAIEGRAGLARKEDLLQAIQTYSEKEIKKAMGLDWKKKIGLFGSIASIIGIILALWSHSSSQTSSESIKTTQISIEKHLDDLPQRILDKISNSGMTQKTEEEYKKKFAEQEEEISKLKGVDPKKKESAIEAFKKGNFAEAKKLYADLDKQTKERRELVNQEIDKKQADIVYNRGNIAYLELDFKEALAFYLEAESLDPNNVLYLNQIGILYLTLGKYKQAKNYFEKALAINLKTYSKDHPKVATTWNNLGSTYDFLGQYDKAIGYYEQALESDLKTYGKDHPSVARVWNNLGSAYDSLGQDDKAIEYFEQALEHFIANFGEEHGNVAVIWNNLGGAYASLGQYDKAIGYYEQALESDLKTYGKDHPSVARVWNNLGLAYYSLGQYDKAIKYYEQALKSDLKTYGKGHPDVAISWNNLGTAYYFLGQYDKAIDYYEQALESGVKTYGKDHPDVAIRWNNLGSVYYKMGKYKEAISYFEKALVVRKKMLGDDHPSTKTSQKWLDMARKKLVAEGE